jgi:hypothetical protein
MELPLLGETGTQPQDTKQEDNNTTEKECIHNGEEEEGTMTGTCQQIQNKDKEKQKITISIGFNIGKGE